MLYVKWFRKEHHKYKERRYLQQTHQWSIQMWFFWLFATLIICCSLAAATFSTLCVDSASLKDYCVDRFTDCWHEALLLRTAVESCSRRHPLGARTFNILQIHVSRHIGMCAHKPSVAIYRSNSINLLNSVCWFGFLERLLRRLHPRLSERSTISTHRCRKLQPTSCQNF